MNYTGVKTIEKLQSQVRKTRLDELEKKAVWEGETARETELERALTGK